MEAVMLQYYSKDQQMSSYKTQIRTPMKGLNRPPPPRSCLARPYPPFSIQQQQPPLLPLPISKPQNINKPLSRVKSLSCPPNNRKANKSSKPQATTSPKKEAKSEGVFGTLSAKPLGPDPKDLPKNVPKTLALSSFSGSSDNNNSLKDKLVDEFSGFVAYTISPPPSSLPLPTFSLRPKLSCNAQVQAAAGIDTGATDNLRRLLRLPY